MRQTCALLGRADEQKPRTFQQPKRERTFFSFASVCDGNAHQHVSQPVGRAGCSVLSRTVLAHVFWPGFRGHQIATASNSSSYIMMHANAANVFPPRSSFSRFHFSVVVPCIESMIHDVPMCVPPCTATSTAKWSYLVSSRVQDGLTATCV